MAKNRGPINRRSGISGCALRRHRPAGRGPDGVIQLLHAESSGTRQAAITGAALLRHRLKASAERSQSACRATRPTKKAPKRTPRNSSDIKMVPRGGFEPPTRGFSGRYYTPVFKTLGPKNCKFWDHKSMAYGDFGKQFSPLSHRCQTAPSVISSSQYHCLPKV